MGDRNTDDDRPHPRGRNDVVTPLPYQNAALFRDAEFVERLSGRAPAAPASTRPGSIPI
jgi:hypothetical protein